MGRTRPGTHGHGEACIDCERPRPCPDLSPRVWVGAAGEGGKGFAVVADEVRKLAERSSRATKEIAELIAYVQRETEEAVLAMETGSREVAAGTGLADEAGASLEAITSTVSATKAAGDRIPRPWPA